MNVTQQIMRRFKIDSNTALEVRLRADENGLDYSGCTQRQFNDAMDEAFAELFGVELLLQARGKSRVSA